MSGKMSSQGTPRKFSEKIAILQRKQNEEEDAFAKVMQDVRSITSHDTSPSSIQDQNGQFYEGNSDGMAISANASNQQLLPGQWNRPGGIGLSLPNVHQIVQHEQPGQWGYWESPTGHQRGRSPGGGSHYHPYNKPSRSQERVPPLHHHYAPYPPVPPQHLQPPEYANFYRARSDPMLHSSAPHAHPAYYGGPPGYPGGPMGFPPGMPQQMMNGPHQQQGNGQMPPPHHHPHHPQHPHMGQPGVMGGMGVMGQPPPQMGPPPSHMNGPQQPPNSINMQSIQQVVHQMQPGPSGQGGGGGGQQGPQGGQQMGSPMQGMSPATTPPHQQQQQQQNSVQSPMGGMCGSVQGSPMGSTMGSPMHHQHGGGGGGMPGSGPMSPIEDHRIMELCSPFEGGDGIVGSLPNVSSMVHQHPHLHNCYHPPIGQRHSTGCVRNSPEVIDIPNIVLTGADGGAGELDCFQDLADLHLDPTEMQMLCNGPQPDPLSETQLLKN